MTLPPDIPCLKAEAERLAREFCSCDFVFMERLLRNLTRHESRFAAARWLESIGRPGWCFLDGPGPLTPEQSARVLHEACLRARSGTAAIVGALGPWEVHVNSAAKSRFSVIPKLFDAYATAHVSCWYLKSGTLLVGEDVERDIADNVKAAEASALANGWFCL